jgi:hypothetical protein
MQGASSLGAVTTFWYCDKVVKQPEDSEWNILSAFFSEDRAEPENRLVVRFAGGSPLFLTVDEQSGSYEMAWAHLTRLS